MRREKALYLGEIDDQQQALWRKSLAVFDEEKQQFTELSLFAEDRPQPEDAVDSTSHKRPPSGSILT